MFGTWRSRTVAAVTCVAAILASGMPASAAAGDPPASCRFTNVGSNEYLLDWDAVAGVDKYIVRRSVGEISSASEPFWQSAPAAGTTSTTLTGNPANGDPVQYFVSTKTGATESTLTPCRLYAPTGVTATATGTTALPAVTISWDADPDASVGYNVYWANGTTPINASPITTTSFTVTDGLTQYSSPGFRVTAISHDPRDGGTDVESAYSVADGAPGTPTLQSAAPGPDDGTLTLSWTPVADAQNGYNIYRNDQIFASSTDAATTFVIDTPGINGALALGTHDWTIKARAHGDFHSAPSNPASATVNDTQRPDPPGALTVTSHGATTAQLTWNSPDQTQSGTVDPSGFETYRVYHDSDPTANRENSDDEVLAQGPSTSAALSGLTPGNTYDLYVTVIDGADNESYISNTVTITASDNQPPTPPTDFTATVNPDSSITTSWTASTDNVAVTGYRLFLDENAAGDGIDHDEYSALESNTSSTVPPNSLAPGTHDLYVMAYDDAGNESTASNKVTITIGAPPATPAAPTVTDNADGTLTITWDPVANATSYRVYRDLSPTVAADPNQWPANPFAATSGTTWTDTTITEIPSTHSYRIVAVNANGTSAMSDLGWATVTDGAAPPPEAFSTAYLASTGRWELVDTSNPTVPNRWESINVRADVGAFSSLDQADLNELATRFDTIRLNLHWDDVQPSRNSSVATSLDSSIRDFIVMADTAGVNVIIDPLHLGGGSENAFWIPQWAWDDAWQHPIANNDGSLMTQTARNFANANQATPVEELHHPVDSLEVLTWNVQAGVAGYATEDLDKELAVRYLEDVLEWINTHEAAGTFDNVVALELLNEPHPYNGAAYNTAATIADIQIGWASTLRAIDPDKLFIVTGYYGGSLADAAATGQAYSNASVAGLVYSAHTYYTGIEAPDNPNVSELRDFDDNPEDGFADLDAPNPWWFGAKTGTRTESYDRAGCYGDPGTSGATAFESLDADCLGYVPLAVRDDARESLIRSIEAQDAVAQASQMPLFMGEFGVVPYAQRNNSWYGWGNAKLLMCDHVVAFRSLDGGLDANGDPLDALEAPTAPHHAVSYAAWQFDTQAGSFGMYNSSTNTWLDDGATAGLNFGQNPENQGIANVFAPNNTYCTG